MATTRAACCAILAGILSLSTVHADDNAFERTGWTATLNTFFHDVSGTVTVIDADTFRVDEFTYDGEGPSVFFYLASDFESLPVGIGAGPDLAGPIYDGVSLVVDLPAGRTLDEFDVISVWCVEFDASFGQGTFVAPRCVADYDANGVVDVVDLLGFLSNWYPRQIEADINLDGRADVVDLLDYLSEWYLGADGRNCA